MVIKVSRIARVKGRVDTQGRECSTCGRYQLWVAYSRNYKGIGGKSSICNTCRHRSSQVYRLKLNPGLKLHKTWRIDENGRECICCKTYKPWKDYSRDKGFPRGYHSWCFSCKRQRKNLRVYGIGYLEFQERLLKQKGVCAICGKPESWKEDTGNIRPLSIDHDHVTNKIRGLLCSSCNMVLGLMGDSANRLLKASEYLSRNAGSE